VVLQLVEIVLAGRPIAIELGHRQHLVGQRRYQHRIFEDLGGRIGSYGRNWVMAL